MCDSLIHNLRSMLLKTSMKTGQQLFDSLVKAILQTTNCDLCSLWSINTNNTNGGFKSASLIARDLRINLSYNFVQEEDYVHELSQCFIMDVLNATEKTKKTYHSCTLSEGIHHKSPGCIDTLKLQYFIGIPIPSYDDSTKAMAVLKLSYTEDPLIEKIELLSEIIRDFVRSSLHRFILLQKQQIMDDLIKNYKRNGQKKNIADIFRPIIDIIRKNYCQCEGASFFMWDSYNNRYNLLATTGIYGIDSKDYSDVFYQSGEGLTGKVAEVKVARIYDNLEAERANSEHKEKWKESTTHTGKTMMVIPLFRPSNGKDIIGILRLINKTNSGCLSVIDYFNDVDVDLISYASNYIALFIDYFLGEEAQNDFISKLSHEFYTPAHSIHKTAHRLFTHKDDDEFVKRYLAPYLEDIIYYAEFQKWQATTNLYLSKIRRKIPLAKRYNISRCMLRDMINRSKDIVVPIARTQNVPFDNIVIESTMPSVSLYIDEIAFVAIFYNLLTNAIKYHNPDVKFHVSISGYEAEKFLFIYVTDYGLGILEEDKQKIFQVGYRGENVTQYNTSGFGVGLPVVKQIINDFGGEIDVINLKSPTKIEIKLPKDLYTINYTKTDKWIK